MTVVRPLTFAALLGAGTLLSACTFLPSVTPADPQPAGSDDGQTEQTTGDVVSAVWATRGDEVLEGVDAVDVECPPAGEGDLEYAVWGTLVYTDDSSVCAAAVHGGFLDPTTGGVVRVVAAPGQESYEGSDTGLVTSSAWGSWDASFEFGVE